MSDLRTEHRKAMDLAESAFISLAIEGPTKAKPLFEQALKAELVAVDLARKESVAEPTFSVLHRSAASLAIRASQFRLAEQLITRALSGDPPPEIAEELRDLLETVYFDRHLNVRGVALSADELQLSVAGKARKK